MSKKIITVVKTYGPYTRKDDRKHVVHVMSDGSKKTQSYPRYLMEKQLGRKIRKNENVDHINHDKTDNAISNLQVITFKKNYEKEMARPERMAKWVEFNCPVCGTKSKKRKNNVDANLKKGKSGPYCSRHCAGKSSVGK